MANECKGAPDTKELKEIQGDSEQPVATPYSNPMEGQNGVFIRATTRQEKITTLAIKELGVLEI